VCAIYLDLYAWFSILSIATASAKNKNNLRLNTSGDHVALRLPFQQGSLSGKLSTKLRKKINHVVVHIL
jgi:hypothetical protein